MYSRGFGVPSSDVKIPEKYDGTALRDIPAEEEKSNIYSMPVFSDSGKAEIKISPGDISSEPTADSQNCSNENEESKPAGIFSFAPSRLISKFMPNGLNFANLIPKIELEEIIILGLAVLLFFSKSGDKECALILLALLFIT